MFAGEMTYVRPFTASCKTQVPDKGAKSIELTRLDPVRRPSSEAAKHKKLANPKAVDVTVELVTDQIGSPIQTTKQNMQGTNPTDSPDHVPRGDESQASDQTIDSGIVDLATKRCSCPMYHFISDTGICPNWVASNRSICQMCYEYCLGAGIDEDPLG
ncbi:unnamed protein product [Clonostachys solani]|uniref:Uncharacterized protein n=1 Tax=Clonostachys solani TaxID=160281 RepID=A0A9N9VWG5_9HYPO|nr:unnamed protein product [Clonostachys solani]